MEKRKIDVIIPTYKPGEEFGKLIHRLEEQEYRPDRILVMNTGKQYWNTEWEKSSILEVHHLEQQIDQKERDIEDLCMKMLQKCRMRILWYL